MSILFEGCSFEKMPRRRVKAVIYAGRSCSDAVSGDVRCFDTTDRPHAGLVSKACSGAGG
jgi:hypothetical protein